MGRDGIVVDSGCGVQRGAIEIPANLMNKQEQQSVRDLVRPEKRFSKTLI